MRAVPVLLALSAVEGLLALSGPVLSEVEGVEGLPAVPALSESASNGTFMTLGGELRFKRPAGWTLDDQWFRNPPFATLSPEGEPELSINIERYAADNPLHLTPRSFPGTLMTRRSRDKVARRQKKIAGRTVTVYEVHTPAVPGRAPDSDEYGDVLGGGKPGIRSKVARCVKAGAYAYVPAHNESLKDKAASDDFRKTFLDGGHLSKVIEVCLGAPLLAQMRRGEPIALPPQPPDEKELARLEALDKSPALPEGWESIAVVEAKGRFYVLRFAAPKERYRSELPMFQRVLDSLEIVR